jgi:hypothetical protein
MSCAGLVTEYNRRGYFRLLAAKVGVKFEVSGKENKLSTISR